MILMNVKKKIAILGTGIAGLTLAYAFSKHPSFHVHMYTAKEEEDMRNGRIPSSQVHFHSMLDTELLYDMEGYGDVNDIRQIELVLQGQPLFVGNLSGRAITVDQRIYLPALLEKVRKKGIPIIKKRLEAFDLLELAKEYDVLIDCSGKVGPIAPFKVYEELRNPLDTPKRVCSVGFFHGLSTEEVGRLRYHIAPGMGELFEVTNMTRQGLVRALLLESIPGGPLDQIKGEKGPIDFAERMMGILQQHFPQVYERVDPEQFRLVDEHAYNRLAIKPEVRIPYLMLNGTLVLGCGDSVTLNDPITGQGANAASYCAKTLFDVVTEHGDQPWDESLGEAYWDRTKDYVIRLTEWTNAMMGAPSAAFAAKLEQASQQQHVADEVVNLFADPRKAHRVFFNE
jgi:hypothetical protein